MNPAKRKKLFRLELQKKQSQITETILEEKVIQKEETATLPLPLVVSESSSVNPSNIDLGLKLPEADLLESKKDKKKKHTSQDV